MADADTPPRDSTPSTSFAPATTATTTAVFVPQKRAIEEDHAPSVPSPLNPDVRSTPQAQSTDDMPAHTRDKRAKKESYKKRESKVTFGGDSNRGTPDPKGKSKNAPSRDKEEPSSSESGPLRYKLPAAKQTDFDPPRGPVFISHHEVPSLDGQGKIAFFETSDHVYNKKSYHYTHCIADPAFPSSLYYRQTEPFPHGPHMSFEDSATHMFFDQSGRHITTHKGFRMTRANVAIRQGRFYYEVKINRGIVKDPKPGDPESNGHVRMGFARREAAVDAPVGFDAYSYGIRDKAGQKVYMSRPKDFFPAGEDIQEGDVIGLEIQLPSEHLHRKVVTGRYNPAVDLDTSASSDPPHGGTSEAPNIVRDRIPIRFKAHIYFEQIDYHTCKELEDLMSPNPVVNPDSAEQPNPVHALPALRTLPGSHIKVYKNGVPMGTAFEDLLAFLPPASKPLAAPGAREGFDDGMLGYYPAVSVFRGGAAEVNFGPDFWCPPGASPGQKDMAMGGVDDARAPLLPVSDRYTEQIAEDVVYDIIDEVDFWMQDGGQVLDHAKDERKGGNDVGLPDQEEIKEVVQDD
ncbi:hypothetical protein BN1708_016286 [Verticillium longisporum]|uniref:B30.2/SPRY domain-containing protein n=1 Tax=Verticillium longisporum TaxID=100787 RepID=A0A0G4MI04_VERLO|nr:hypothetical protein BN1708_016286 [Verticillium longisporum]